MTTTYRTGRWVVSTVLAVLLPGAALAGDGIKGFGPYQPDHPTVELFEAIQDAQLEVRLIPRDSAQSRLLVENKSGKPLNVRIPEAMGATAVLAQFQGLRALNGDEGGGNDAPQPLGLGTPPMQGGPHGQDPGPMNFMLFNIAPEVVGQIKLSSVCLEHGRANPKPTIPYALKRIEEVTARPELNEICAMLGRGEIGQKAAQAAAWHLNNEMSWEELRRERIDTILSLHSKLLFTPRQIDEAIGAVKKAEQRTRGETGDWDSSLTARR